MFSTKNKLFRDTAEMGPNANAEKRVNTDFSRAQMQQRHALSLSVFFRYISFSRLRFLTQGQKCADLISHLND